VTDRTGSVTALVSDWGRIDIRDGVLAPHETLDLQLTAHLDDTIMHKDVLHIIVTEGDNLAVRIIIIIIIVIIIIIIIIVILIIIIIIIIISQKSIAILTTIIITPPPPPPTLIIPPSPLQIPLSARGTGTTIFCSESLIWWTSQDIHPPRQHLHHHHPTTTTLTMPLLIIITAVLVLFGQIPLSARGTGTTIFCSEGLDTVDFGPQFTNRQCDRRFTLENRGRRKQKLRWTNETVRIVACSACDHRSSASALALASS
jgi:hypothetical protein